jgi:S-adenosylmethionine decarboxylase proenzyme
VKSLGRHLIVELWEATNLNSRDTVEVALRDTVKAIDGQLLDLRVVTFPVHGVTGVAVIAESHVAIHTWPEHGYAAIDIFTCNLDADLEAGIDAMKRHFLPGRTQVMEIRRGLQE